MEIRCKNCKYFKRYTDERYSNKYGKCDCDKFQYDISKKEETETDKLYYMDYEWYNADIEVGEDFGCVHCSIDITPTTITAEDIEPATEEMIKNKEKINKEIALMIQEELKRLSKKE